MNSIPNKNKLATAILLALGSASSGVAWADSVTGLLLKDVGSNTANAANTFSSTLDGRSGGFKFAPINIVSYPGASLFTGDVGSGTLLAQGMANPTGSFSTGFEFSGAPFVPFTFGSNFSADIDIDNAGTPKLDISSLDFGGNFGGGSNFLLPPDAGTLEVLWVNREGLATPGEFNVAFRWSHDITSAEDPSLAFTTFTARWVLEGVATVADQAPKVFIKDSGGTPSSIAGDISTDVTPNTAYVDPGAVCQDVVDGQISGGAFTTTINNPNAPDTGPAGSQFSVDYACTDSQGNIGTATRTVQAGADTVSPAVTLSVGATESGRSDTPDGSAVKILVGVPYVDAGASCVDNLDGNISLGSTGGPSFTVSPDPAFVDTSTASTGNQITFTCTDSTGNPPTTAVRTVDVLADNVPPTLTLVGANPFTTAAGSPYKDPGATCLDTNPVDAGSVDISSSVVQNPLDIDTGNTGTFTITYTCSDAAGNAASPLTRTVNVAAGQNFRIKSMTISDVDGDGLPACFKFNSLDPVTCAGAQLFSSDDSGNTGIGANGDTDNARIPGVGLDKDANGNPVGVKFGEFQPILSIVNPPPPELNIGSGLPLSGITPGFRFTGFAFVPTTFDPHAATNGRNPEVATPPEGFVTVTGPDSALLTIDSMPFGGLFNSNTPNLFFLDPDDGTLATTITAVNDDDNGSTRTFNYVMTWDHNITELEDPTEKFTNFRAFWRLEGVITAEAQPFVINNPPQVDAFTATQGARSQTTIVAADGGLVTVSVNATDPDGDGLTFDWSQNPVNATGATDQAMFTFDPSSLAPGPLALQVAVGDDAAEPQTVTGRLILNVLDSAPALSATDDSDGDGVSDADEGFGDADNDGIPDYQDPIDGNSDPGRNRIDFRNPARGDMVASAGTLRLGSTVRAAGSGTFVASEDDITRFGGPGAIPVANAHDRLNDVLSVGPIANGIRDFIIDGLTPGATVQVVIPQDASLPIVPTYRKYTVATGWVPFNEANGNALASAPKVGGVCPPPSDPVYDTPLNAAGQTVMVAGDECVRLTIVEGGANDADRTRNGVILDPGTVSSNGPGSSASVGSSGGCTLRPGNGIRGDWWLVLIGVLGLAGMRRKGSRKRAT